MTTDLKFPKFYRSTGSFKAVRATPAPRAFGGFGSQWRVEPRLISKPPITAVDGSSAGPRGRSMASAPSRPGIAPTSRGQRAKGISRDEVISTRLVSQRPGQRNPPPFVSTGHSRADVRLPTISSPSYALNGYTRTKNLIAGLAFSRSTPGSTADGTRSNTNNLFAGVIRRSLLDERYSNQGKPGTPVTPAKHGSGLNALLDNDTRHLPRQLKSASDGVQSTKAERVQAGGRVSNVPRSPRFSQPVEHYRPEAVKGPKKLDRNAGLLGHSGLARSSPLGTERPAVRDPGSTPQSGNAASVSQPSGVAGELWLDTLSLRDWLHSYLTGEVLRSSQATKHVDGGFAEG